jgi:hypothetical protein
MSSGFAPSIEQERAEGHPVTRMEYPAGLAGVKLSLEQIAQRIREGAKSPKVQGVAFDTLYKAGFTGRSGNAGDTRQRAAALLDFVRSVTLYAPDPPNVEMTKSAETLLCLRDGLCVRGGDCFPEDTLLLRDDFSLVRIKDIAIGDRIWGHNAWTIVKKKWASGIKTLDALRLNNGSIVPLSPEHHIFVGPELDRVTVADADVGMKLPQPTKIDFGKGSADLGKTYVEGLFISEGWAESNRFAISGLDGHRKEAIKHEVKAVCDRLGIHTRWHKKYISVCDKLWAIRLAGVGAVAWEKQAPTLDLKEDVAVELLRGIMSDSTANTNGPGRTFSTTSRVLAIQMRVLQRMFGRSTSIRMLTPDQHKGFGQHNLYRVGIRGGTQNKPKPLKIKSIERAVAKANCFDITTDDGFVYLPEHDVTVSNCDDMCVLLGSMLMSVGIPVLVLKQTFGSDDQEHVLIEALDDSGHWFPLDPSTDLPAGTKSPSSAELRIDPTSNLEVGLGNHIPEAEFIGVGAVAWRFNMPTAMHTNAIARRAGLGAPLSWEMNPDGNKVMGGLLYEIALFTPTALPGGAVDALGNPTGAAWSAQDTTNLFPGWTIVSVAPGHATGGDFLSWIVQGTPPGAQTLTGANGVQYVTVLRQVTTGAPPNLPTNPNPANSTIGAAEALIGMLILGAAAGIGWGVHQRHKKASRGRR